MAEPLTEVEQHVFDYVHSSDHPKDVTIMELMGELDLGYDEVMNALNAIHRKVKDAYNEG